MNTISDTINKKFEKLFEKKEIEQSNDNNHPFFRDLKKVHKAAPEYRKSILNNIKKRINYKEINNIPDGVKVKPTYEILNINELKKLDYNMSNKTTDYNYNKIFELVSLLSKYLIKSNVSDKEKLYKTISNNKKDVINIMIIGSGPVGLFLACYLHLYYNETSMKSSPRVNIVMYDSRIDKPGFRKPYNRQRIFATSSKYLSLVIPKLYCWSEKEHFTVNIFLLEYVLFTVANNHYNIPMIYEDYDWDDYKKIIDKGKFDVVFDCTGGRLHHDVIKNVNADWVKKMNSKILGKELTIKEKDNLVILENDKNHIINYFFGSMELHHNDKTLTFHSKYDIDIMNSNDLIYLNKIKDKYYKYDDAINLIQGIKDSSFRDFLYTMLTKNTTNKELLIKFDVWGVYMRHQIKISDTFIVNKRKILLIGAGDTIFHSHFITGSGLNRIFDFTVKCANQLDKINTI
jgi:hypothetical protein